MIQETSLGFVVGLAAEARIAANFGYPVRTGGGTPTGAEAAAKQLVSEGATALVSFGLAGGLDPSLRPGAVIIPSVVLSRGRRFSADAALADRFGGLTGHTSLAGQTVASDAAEKQRLRAAMQADAIDLESGAIAAVAEIYHLPFLVVRAICDPAERTLPPAALIALRPDGAIGFSGILRSILSQPMQIPGLLALARDAALAHRALSGVAKRFRIEAGKCA